MDGGQEDWASDSSASSASSLASVGSTTSTGIPTHSGPVGTSPSSKPGAIETAASPASSPTRRPRRASYLGSLSESSSIVGAYKNALQQASALDAELDVDDDTVTAETRRRHDESKRRVALADGTQLLLAKAHELSAEVEDMPLWVHACIVPHRWRREALELLEPVYRQMTFCRDELVGGWELLLPPFDAPNVEEYDRRYQDLNRSVAALERAIIDIQTQFIEGERTVAAKFIQRWYRHRLAKRGFYTKVLKINRRHRGLIPGLFDSIQGKSKLTVRRGAHTATLEYPSASQDFGFMDG